MDELPIRQYEYERSVLLVDFLKKIRLCFESDTDISEILFTPKINGYEISCLKDEIRITFDLKMKGVLYPCLKIRKYENEELKSSYISKSNEDNNAVIQKIIVL